MNNKRQNSVLSTKNKRKYKQENGVNSYFFKIIEINNINWINKTLKNKRDIY